MPVISEAPMFDCSFEARCKREPQEVIKTLVKQTSRQAKTIHDKGKRIDELDRELSLFLTVLKTVADEDTIEEFEAELTKRRNKRKK